MICKKKSWKSVVCYLLVNRLYCYCCKVTSGLQREVLVHSATLWEYENNVNFQWPYSIDICWLSFAPRLFQCARKKNIESCRNTTVVNEWGWAKTVTHIAHDSLALWSLPSLQFKISAIMLLGNNCCSSLWIIANTCFASCGLTSAHSKKEQRRSC